MRILRLKKYILSIIYYRCNKYTGGYKFMKNELKKSVTFIAAIIVVLALALCFMKGANTSDASEVLLWNNNYTTPENFNDENYIIKVHEEKEVIVTSRKNNKSKTYGWSHVIHISYE